MVAHRAKKKRAGQENSSAQSKKIIWDKENSGARQK